jgi:hypothetical protein
LDRPGERRREFAAANPQVESYLEREHKARRTAYGVAHATSGITANVLTLLLPRSILARDQLNPYPQGAGGKEVEQGQSHGDQNVRLRKGTVHRGYAHGVMQMLDRDATPQEGMNFHCTVLNQELLHFYYTLRLARISASEAGFMKESTEMVFTPG